VAQVMEKRVESLEQSYGGGGDGCPRCRGVLITIRDAITYKFRSASYNGKALSEDELAERLAEATCPRCGREIDHDEGVVIEFGGSEANDSND
jgi:hypothetical protein